MIPFLSLSLPLSNLRTGHHLLAPAFILIHSALTCKFLSSLPRFATAVELYSSLGGVRVQSMQGDSVVLEIPSNTQPVGLDESSPSLILTIKFRLQGGTQAVFAGA